MKKDRRIGILSVVIVLLVAVIILLATKTISFDFLLKSGDVTEGMSSKENVDDQDSNDNNKEATTDNDDSSNVENSNNSQVTNSVEIAGNKTKYSSVIENYKKQIQDYCVVPGEDSYNSYAYYDIDQNGTDEILIFYYSGKKEGYETLVDIYTYDGTKPVDLLDPKGSMCRCDVSILKNGIIFEQIGTGASTGWYRFSRINSNGSGPEVLNEFSYVYGEYDDLNGSSVSWYTVDGSRKLSLEEISDHLSTAMRYFDGVEINIDELSKIVIE